MRRSLIVVVLAAAALLAGPMPAAAVGVGGRVSEPASSVQAASGSVGLAAGAAATRSETVAVSIPAPDGPESRLRVSNDGGTTWAERSYATLFDWSLIDPSAGGVDADGPKTVTVEAGDGSGAWRSVGDATILLDRTAPVASGCGICGTTGWVASADYTASDAGVGVAETQVSLDGEHWRRLSPHAFTFWGPDIFDLREGQIGGTWATGQRHAFFRSVDRLGNMSAALDAVAEVDPAPGIDDIPGVRFEFPSPAVSGDPFTIRPVFEGGYRVPSGYHCEWTLLWGSDAARLEAIPDETFGEVVLPRAAHAGVCDPWTVSLPYTAPLLYTWHLAIVSDVNIGEQAYGTSWPAGSFRAAPGSTDPAIGSSNFPLYYVLPDRSLVPTAGTVTYRLHAAGTSTVSTKGMFWCNPANVGDWAGESKVGGTTFTCHVTRSGPWVAGWRLDAAHAFFWRSQYDPVSDRRIPTVTAPVVRVAASLGPSATLPPVDVTWSGHDVGTGVFRYELQRAVNGGSYAGIRLPTGRTTSIGLRLHAGWTYRFRVRARDRAGNWGAWAYSAPVRGATYDETSSVFAWSGGWTRSTAPGSSGGAIRSATAPGATATVRFTGRSVGWYARRGPGQGFAQVWVDGVLLATVNLEATALQPSLAVYRRTWSSSGAHTLKIRVLGTLGRPAVEVDAVEVVR